MYSFLLVSGIILTLFSVAFIGTFITRGISRGVFRYIVVLCIFLNIFFLLVVRVEHAIRTMRPENIATISYPIQKDGNVYYFVHHAKLHELNNSNKILEAIPTNDYEVLVKYRTEGVGVFLIVPETILSYEFIKKK